KPFQRPEAPSPYDALDMIPLVLKVRERSALNSFRPINHTPPVFEKDENGTLICSMEAENSIELMLRIIQCGDAVEILEPANYRKRFCQMLKTIIGLYE
ncbi:MAG: WYL domain-containing protein, partial [Sphaerochaetaceae bacterium]|nr:WYL domain-containing protein [Sphaerochaetaceae bacterium]